MNTEQILNVALDLAGIEHPPADTAVHVPGNNIKKVMMGIDIDTSELLLAKELGVDLVITHHPGGNTTATDFSKVMETQIQRMVSAGVPINKAQKALASRIEKREVNSYASNYDRTVTAAKLLNMPFMSVHSPCDLIVEKLIQEKLDALYAANPQIKVQDIIDELMTIEEYQKDLRKPVTRVGSKDSYAGKPFVTMAGGTGGGADVFKAYFEAGVGTIVGMHIPEADIQPLKEQNIGNFLVAGHMSSDSVGINVFLNKLEANGIEVIRASGIL